MTQDSYTEIIPNIWIGDYRSSNNTFFIRKNKITCVLNCTNDVEFLPIIKEKYRIPIDDSPSEVENQKMFGYLKCASNFINNMILEGHRILIHCYAGQQRSCTILTAYLMKYCNLSLKNSVKFIQNKRQIAFLKGINFYPALIKFERIINSKEKKILEDISNAYS
jgi:dual specificity phosphatase 12